MWAWTRILNWSSRPAKGCQAHNNCDPHQSCQPRASANPANTGNPAHPVRFPYSYSMPARRCKWTVLLFIPISNHDDILGLWADVGTEQGGEGDGEMLGNGSCVSGAGTHFLRIGSPLGRTFRWGVGGFSMEPMRIEFIPIFEIVLKFWTQNVNKRMSKSSLPQALVK